MLYAKLLPRQLSGWWSAVSVEIKAWFGICSLGQFKLLETLSFPLFSFLCFAQYNSLLLIIISPLSRSFYDSCPVNTKRYIYNVIAHKGSVRLLIMEQFRWRCETFEFVSFWASENKTRKQQDKVIFLYIVLNGKTKYYTNQDYYVT